MDSKSPIAKLNEEWVVEALQIISNYCTQSVENCKECYLRMNDKTCLFRAELPDRFKKWKKERNING